jgi:hypothetical protein
VSERSWLIVEVDVVAVEAVVEAGVVVAVAEEAEASMTEEVAFVEAVEEEGEAAVVEVGHSLLDATKRSSK